MVIGRPEAVPVLIHMMALRSLRPRRCDRANTSTKTSDSTVNTRSASISSSITTSRSGCAGTVDILSFPQSKYSVVEIWRVDGGQRRPDLDHPPGGRDRRAGGHRRPGRPGVRLL